ncbi:MAG: type II secretion system F family protein [Anaerolineae bacterium]
MNGISGPLLFGFLVGLAVLVGFIALWRIIERRDPTEDRLRRYGKGREAPAADEREDRRRRQSRPWMVRLLAGFGIGPRLARALTRADVPLTVPEFLLIMFGAGLVGLLIGLFRVGPALGPVVGPIAGLALAVVLGALPWLYLQMKQARRRRVITEQLPDVLTLLVGALRSGQGLSQAMRMLVDEVPPPAGDEFARVNRAMELGLSVQDALWDMAERVGSDDLDLVVTAITVQYQMGGNLAETLETISETVRDRINMLREIRVLTAQQRYTGYVLALLPLITGVLIFIVNPEYMGRLFEPGWVRILPAGAVLMQIVGYLIMRRIVDIEV